MRANKAGQPYLNAGQCQFDVGPIDVRIYDSGILMDLALNVLRGMAVDSIGRGFCWDDDVSRKLIE